MEKIADKIHHHDSSSSSDSEKEEEEKKTTSSMEAKVRRLFGRQQPVHKVLGGGKREFLLSIQHHSFLPPTNFQFMLINR